MTKPDVLKEKIMKEFDEFWDTLPSHPNPARYHLHREFLLKVIAQTREAVVGEIKEIIKNADWEFRSGTHISSEYVLDAIQSLSKNNHTREKGKTWDCPNCLDGKCENCIDVQSLTKKEEK